MNGNVLLEFKSENPGDNVFKNAIKNAIKEKGEVSIRKLNTAIKVRDLNDSRDNGGGDENKLKRTT